MTTKANEAGARADDLSRQIRRIIGGIYGLGDAPYAGGFQDKTIDLAVAKIAALVPSSAAAAERERCAAEVERRNWPCVGDARRIAAMLRALSPATASGEFVVVPRKLTPDMIVQGYEHVNRDLCEGKGDALDRLWTAMLNAATKDGERA